MRASTAAFLVVALSGIGGLAACGKAPPEDIIDIQGPYPLHQMLSEAPVVVEGILAEIDRGSLRAILDVKRTLRGACPHRRIQLRLEIGFLPYHDLLRRQLVENAPAILLLGPGDSGGAALYYNRVFYLGTFRSDLPGPPLWIGMYLERALNRAYNGSVDSLAELLRKSFAGEEALPGWRPELPPIDTPALRALPLPGQPVDEDYLPEPFRR